MKASEFKSVYEFYSENLDNIVITQACGSKDKRIRDKITRQKIQHVNDCFYKVTFRKKKMQIFFESFMFIELMKIENAKILECFIARFQKVKKKDLKMELFNGRGAALHLNLKKNEIL